MSWPGLEEDSPGSPRLDRLSLRSESEVSVGQEDTGRTVVSSLLAAVLQQDRQVREAAASSLARIGEQKPFLVLSEWHLVLGRERRRATRETPNTARRNSSLIPNPGPSTTVMLVEALEIVMTKVITSDQLDAGDVRHRAVLGQVVSSLVEEMINTVEVEEKARNILVSLAGDYMDKIMDVVLVQFQPNTPTLSPAVVSTLGSLAKHHQHGAVPYVKSLLATSAVLMKNVKISEVIRLSFSEAISHFCEAVLDLISHQSPSTESPVKTEQYETELDLIYDCLCYSWLPSARDRQARLSILAALAAVSPFLSKTFLKEKCANLVLNFLQLYKKLTASLGSPLEITLCLSQLLSLVTKTSPCLLEPVLDPLFNTLFQQVCVGTDYSKAATVRNHNEVLRCYDIMVRHFPVKLVSGLINKVETSEERLKIGALTVVKHLLHLPSTVLGDRLEDILGMVSSRLSDPSRNVQSCLAQIVLMLGHHGVLTGDRGRACLEFIIRLCGSLEVAGESGSQATYSETLGEMCSNILQLLTTGVPSVQTLLWPHNLEYLLSPSHEAAIPAVTRSLASLASANKAVVDWSEFQYCTSPTSLLARLLVLSSVPQTGGRGVHILKFLLQFSHNLHPKLGAVWQARFPLLLHYLEQHKEKVDLVQWQEWLLGLSLDTASQVSDETWTLDLLSSLVDQLALYDSESSEKSFSVVLSGQLLTLLTRSHHVLDTLSSLFLVSLERSPKAAKSCATAFGLCAATHLELVVKKLEMLHSQQSSRKTSNLTSFFGLLRDRSSEETQARELVIILQCVGAAASKAPAPELSLQCQQLVSRFLAPALRDCRDSRVVREAVMAAVTDLALALKEVLKLQPDFSLPQHDELLTSAVSVLQNGSLSLTCRQGALLCLTTLLELPPNISQITRCELLKASFSTIFSSFLEHESSKSEEYSEARELEQQLERMVTQLQVLIRELLRQDMEPSTLDEIFTLLEPWLKLDQALSRELSANILHRALETYVAGVVLGVNSPSNFTPGPYMMGAVIPRCFDPSRRVRIAALDCVQELVRILGLYEGLSRETVDQSLLPLQALNTDTPGKLDPELLGQTVVSVLAERVQHQHVLSLLDSLPDSLLDTQPTSVAGAIRVMRGLVISRGSEVFQNIPGFVRKLHDKMGLMVIDESSDMVGEVADIIVQFSVHNTRAVVFSLVSMEADKEVRLVWQCLAGEGRLAREAVDVLLEIITEQDRISATNLQVRGSASALTVMLDTRRLEDLARAELGRLVAGLVMMVSLSLGHQESCQVGLESLRSVFSSVGSVVVAGTVVASLMSDYSQLVSLLQRMTEAVCQHSPAEQLTCLVSGQLAVSKESSDSVRVARLAVLGAAAEHRGSLSSLQPVLSSALSQGCADSLPLARSLALHGLSCLPPGPEDTESLRLLVTGLDDQSSAVTLTALRGLVRLLPHSASHNPGLVSSLALKARPYFESSSEEHRAAAISVYSWLEAGDSEQYLDYISTVLLPLLLHSSSDHPATSKACLDTLTAAARATKFKPLTKALSGYSPAGGFPALLHSILSCRCGALIEMYPAAVTASLSYLTSQRSELRRNVVIFLAEVLTYTQATDTGMVTEETLGEIISLVVRLLDDQDKDVRRVAAQHLGKLLLLTGK